MAPSLRHTVARNTAARTATATTIAASRSNTTTPCCSQNRNVSVGRVAPATRSTTKAKARVGGVSPTDVWSPQFAVPAGDETSDTATVCKTTRLVGSTCLEDSSGVVEKSRTAPPTSGHARCELPCSTAPLAAKRRKTTKATEAKPPDNWEEVYQKIKDFRREAANTAPVDVMGCERLGDLDAEPTDFRWQTLVALMLSSQTKDAVTSEAVSRLRAAANKQGRPFDVRFVHDMDVRDLDRCIEKVGFHNRKAIYLKKAADVCLQLHNGDIPNTYEGLVALAGVGPKMAYLALQCAWGSNVGVGVDTHVHRICNRLGWVNSKEPEETRKQLEIWLPPHRWREINPLLVGFGQILCLPRFPRCVSCPVSDLCPSSRIKAGASQRVSIKVEYEETIVPAESGGAC